MDMYQKRKIRAEKKNNDSQKSLPSVGINWYPGHMAKTKKQIIQDLKIIDVVVEVLDARIPLSSHNPDLDDVLKNKKRVVLLNKSDLSEEKENKKWINFFKKQDIPAVLADCNQGKGIKESLEKVREVMQEELKKDAQKGKVGRAIRVLVLGIPNVGKSSYINRLTKKVSAKVGNKPGVTRQKQWVRLDKSIELLDTPGVLWPKLDSEGTALYLAFTGTIKEDILEKTDIAYNLLKYLINNYPENLKTRYNIDIEEANDVILAYMEAIGQKRGALMSGGRIDYEKTAGIILDDFRSGKLGRISLEKTEE